MQGFKINSENPKSNLSLVIENNEESVWCYLLDSEGQLIKDVFALSPIHPIAELDKLSIQKGNPPKLIKSVASETAYQSNIVAEDIQVIWSKSNIDVAVIFKGKPIAAIYNSQKSGYSKSLSIVSGFGQPWSEDLYNEYFTNSC